MSSPLAGLISLVADTLRTRMLADLIVLQFPVAVFAVSGGSLSLWVQVVNAVR